METLEAIATRRSVRAYEEGKQLTKEQLDAILKAFLEAPTARNRQEIRAIVMQDAAEINALNDAFMTYNRNSGRPFARGNTFHYNAPTFIILVAPRDFSYSEIDAGIAVENMALAATSLGLGNVIIGCLGQFFMREDGAAWRAKLGIAPEEMFVIGLAVGTQKGEAKKPTEKDGRVTFYKG